MPFKTFQDYLRRQQRIETSQEEIKLTVLPGHLTATEMLVKGKIDRLEVNSIIKRLLNDQLSKLDLKGASI